jgi:hypothetical protein
MHMGNNAIHTPIVVYNIQDYGVCCFNIYHAHLLSVHDYLIRLWVLISIKKQHRAIRSYRTRGVWLLLYLHPGLPLVAPYGGAVATHSTPPISTTIPHAKFWFIPFNLDCPSTDLVIYCSYVFTFSRTLQSSFICGY